MGRAALNYKAFLREEVPDFTPPRLDPREMAAEPLLEDFRRTSEEYLSQRTEMLQGFESAMQAVVELAEQVASTGGPPELEELIDLTGDHREKAHTEVEPRIEESRRSRQGMAASRHPWVRDVMPPLLDRNIQLMRDYLRVIDQFYDRLIVLRDESIRRSFEALSADVLAGAWDDEDE